MALKQREPTVARREEVPHVAEFYMGTWETGLRPRLSVAPTDGAISAKLVPVRFLKINAEADRQLSWNLILSFVTAPCTIYPSTSSITVACMSASGGAKTTHAGAGKTTWRLFGLFQA